MTMAGEGRAYSRSELAFNLWIVSAREPGEQIVDPAIEIGAGIGVILDHRRQIGPILDGRHRKARGQLVEQDDAIGGVKIGLGQLAQGFGRRVDAIAHELAGERLGDDAPRG